MYVIDIPQWGNNILCISYRGSMEGRNPPFYKCGFSIPIWEKLLQHCYISRNIRSWDSEINWAIFNFERQISSCAAVQIGLE